MWKALDNFGCIYHVNEKEGTYTVNKSDIPEGLEYIDLIDETLFANEGDEGYYVIADFEKKGSRLCYFNQKSDNERIFKQDLMPIFGVKKTDVFYLVIVQGFKYEFSLVFGVNKGRYYIYPRFHLNGNIPTKIST